VDARVELDEDVSLGPLFVFALTGHALRDKPKASTPGQATGRAANSPARGRVTKPGASPFSEPNPKKNPRLGGRRGEMLLLVLLAIVALIAFGAGFVVHWLFIVAAIVALIWLISLFTGGFGRTGAGRL
jgi:hypothetical protein